MSPRSYGKLLWTSLVVGVVAAMFGVLAAAGPASAASGTGQLSPPGNPRITALTFSSLTVAWDPTTSPDDGVTYAVTISPVEINATGLIETATTQATFTRLWPDRTYTVAVLARVGNDFTRDSEQVVVTASTPVDSDAPTAPSGLRVVDTSGGQATLAWHRSNDNDQISTYRVFSGGEPVFFWSTSVGSDAAAVIPQLAPDTTRTFTVDAVDRSGNVSPSSSVTKTMPPNSDTAAPAAPTGLVGSSGYGASVSWNAASDEVTPPAQLDYMLYVDGAPNTYVADGVTTISFFDWSNCWVTLPTGTHTYTVRAVDQAGNTSAPSAPIVLTN